ncbi:MAG: N-acetyltransferase [Pseudomonadota bacterium]
MSPEELSKLHMRAIEAPRPWSTEEFEALLADPVNILVSNNAGFLLGRHNGPEAEILTLVVDPDKRRLGHGRALLEKFETRLAGATSIYLEVAENNEAAISLYQQAGFTQEGRRKNYYRALNGVRHDALVLCKVLHLRPGIP